jgi:hypothetical protein
MDHELTSWIVTYDKAGLCAMIQGFVQTGKSAEDTGKQLIAIQDVGSLDLRNNTLETHSGLTFKLVGPGAQSILTSHIEPFEFIHIADPETDEDYEDGEEEYN